MDHGIPPGWSYNPSRWPERLVLVGLALVGFGIALYLSLYQLGVFPSVWEPFFGNGSRVILHSGLAHLLPVPDAFLGAIGYLVEAISGAIGCSTRWRTRPWVVVVYGIAVGSLGLVSILLFICQPLIFHAWCTLCLASAILSIALVVPAMDEVLASLQYLKRKRTSSHHPDTTLRVK